MLLIRCSNLVVHYIPIHAWLILIAFAFIALLIQILLIPFLWIGNHIINTPVYRYAMRKTNKPRKERFFWLLMTARAFAIGFLFSTLDFLGTFDRTYSGLVYKKASSFLFNYEMYPKSHCETQSSQERFAYINANLVLVAKKTDDKKYIFETRPCIS